MADKKFDYKQHIENMRKILNPPAQDIGQKLLMASRLRKLGQLNGNKRIR